MNFDVLCESHFDDGAPNPEWLELRKTGVTASDVGKILGGGSVMKLWAQKTGRVEPDNLENNERVRWGNILEAAILHGYSMNDYAGRPTVPSGELCRSTEHPWLLATLDAWTEHPDWGTVPLDAKNTDKFEGRKWEEGPPIKYRWQILAQATTVGTPGASIVGLIGGNQLVWTDEELARQDRNLILDATEKFWWCVKNDVPPDQVDGLPETRKALNATFSPEPNTTAHLADTYLEIDEEYARLTALLKDADATARDLKKKKDAVENKLRLALGNREVGQLSSGVVYVQKEIHRKPYTTKPSSYIKFTRKEPK